MPETAPDWQVDSPPRRDGQTFVVTGGSGGIGYFIVEQLAVTGARVVLAARSREKADAAAYSVRSRVADAHLGFVELDLGSLKSVRAAAHKLGESPVDGLVLNAALTTGPKTRETTADGLELVVGTNYAGHFALTAQLAPALNPGARVVALGSMASRLQSADASDLMLERRYSGWRAYATSKHLMQTFAVELSRRAAAAGHPLVAVSAHPGYAVDAQSPRRPGVNDLAPRTRFAQRLLRPFTQGKHAGAWPVVRALLEADVAATGHYGPSRLVAGRPVAATLPAQDLDPAFGSRVWELSEQWTGVRFEL